MIQSVGFMNFKVLRDTILPLGRFTLIVGPNGSGKSTALQAFNVVVNPHNYDFYGLATADLQPTRGAPVQIVVRWEQSLDVALNASWPAYGPPVFKWTSLPSDAPLLHNKPLQAEELTRIRIYSLDPRLLAAPVRLQPNMELSPDGAGLAGVLDRLRDQEPERFESLNQELGRLLPEFDRVLFQTPGDGQRSFLLRVRTSKHAIRAADLSHGTLLVLAILTLAHLPYPPPLIGLEEPDRGIHPRLLREVRDALYRLSYPDSFGEKREPVQVVATTHSPYFLDLFKDHPEEIVIAQKVGLEARFERLVDRPDVEEILADAPLGEVWYSGVLGGVPCPS